jgi:hypothetical protein
MIKIGFISILKKVIIHIQEMVRLVMKMTIIMILLYIMIDRISDRSLFLMVKRILLVSSLYLKEPNILLIIKKKLFLRNLYGQVKQN